LRKLVAEKEKREGVLALALRTEILERIENVIAASAGKRDRALTVVTLGYLLFPHILSRLFLHPAAAMAGKKERRRWVGVGEALPGKGPCGIGEEKWKTAADGRTNKEKGPMPSRISLAKCPPSSPFCFFLLFHFTANFLSKIEIGNERKKY